MKPDVVAEIFTGLYKRKKFWTILLATILLLSFWQLTHLYVDNSLESWFRKDSREMEDYYRFLAEFGNDESLVIVFHKDTAVDLTQLKNDLTEIQQVDTVFSFKSAEYLMVQLVINNRDFDAEGRTAYIAAAREICARHFSGQDRFYLAGMGLLFDTLNQISASNGSLLAGISYLIILLFLVLRLRNLRRVLLSLLIVTVNLVICLGIYAAAGKGINMVTMILPTLILTYSICDIIHFYNHLDIVAARQAGQGELFRQTLGYIAIPCSLTSLTTAIGFLSLTISPVPVVRDLGLFAAVFVMLTFIITMLICTVFSRFITSSPQRPSLSEALPPWYGKLLLKKSGLLLAISLIPVILVGAGMFKLQVDTYSIGFLKEGHPVRQDSAAIEKFFGNYVPLEFLIDCGAEGLSQEKLQALDGFISRVKEQGLADNVFTVFNLFGTTRIPGNRRLAENLIKRIDPAQRRQWVSTAGDQLRISFRIPMSSARGFQELTEQIRLQTELSLQPVGYVPLYINMMQYISTTQLQSFLIAFAAIFLIIFIISRSLKTGLAALGANLFPITLILGLMGWAGIHLDIATSTIAAVSLGVIVDDTIHFIYAYKKIRDGKILGTINTAGRAIFSTSLILFAGFLVMAFAQVQSIALFGLFTALLILLAYYGDMFILPAMLRLLHPKEPPHA